MTHIKQPFVLDSERPYPDPDFDSPGWWSEIPGVGELVYSEDGGVGHLLAKDADGRAIGEMFRRLQEAKDIFHMDAESAFTYVWAGMDGTYPLRVDNLRDRVDRWKASRTS